MAESSEIVAQSAEVSACNEFLGYIRHNFAIEALSCNWLVKLEVAKNYMVLSIKKNKEGSDDSVAFNEEELNFAVSAIDDYKCTKFDTLRQLGWCSEETIGGCFGYIEFSWLNQHKMFGVTASSVSKYTCQPCLLRFDSFR